MHPHTPHPTGTAGRPPSHRRRARRPLRVALAACAVVALAGAGTAGCAAETGAHDGGAAPSLSAPISASPLWPDDEPSATTFPGRDKQATKPYFPVSGVTVPSGGLRDVSVKDLILKDKNVPDLARGEMKACPGPRCALRKPVYRDLTGDGRDELVVALDEERSALTMIQVYRATGHTIRPVLISWGQLGLTGETYGRDLVLTSVGKDGQYTTRYRWDGRVMSVVAPGEETGTPGPRSSAAPSRVRPS